MNTINVKTEKGKVMTLTLHGINITKVKGFLEKHSGLRFGKGEYLSQALGMVHAWMSNHNSKDKNASDVMAAGIYIAAYHYTKKCNGIYAHTDDKKEVMVYVPDPRGEYIIRVQEHFCDLLFEEDSDLDKMIFRVEPMREIKLTA